MSKGFLPDELLHAGPGRDRPKFFAAGNRFFRRKRVLSAVGTNVADDSPGAELSDGPEPGIEQRQTESAQFPPHSLPWGPGLAVVWIV